MVENYRQHFTPTVARQELCAFDKVVLWGLKSHKMHTHYWIFLAYFIALKKLDVPVAWLDDSPENHDLIGPGDLVLIHGTNHHARGILAKGAFVIDFHKEQFADQTLVPDLAAYPYRLEQQAFLPGLNHVERWDLLTSFFPEQRILYQPWAADLLPDEYMAPADSHVSDKIYWTGSIWAHAGWGNWDEMQALQEALRVRNLRFVHFNDAFPDINRLLVRHSRVAPSIAGAGQVGADFLACRFFKNIAYGQFCVSNVPYSSQVLDGVVIHDRDIPSLIEKALTVRPRDAVEMVRHQQKKIANYNIAANLFLCAVAARRLSRAAAG